MIKIGLVGLPNAGKSTLFNLFTANNVAVADYSFTTIEPNVGVMSIYDPRLKILQQIYQSKKIIPSYVKFWDIAGLIEGAHKGQGLGNRFLSHIREVDVICYVVNGFKINSDTTNSYEILKNFQDIQLEIVYADIELLRSYQVKKADFWKRFFLSYKEISSILLRALKSLETEDKFISLLKWSPKEINFLNKLNLLSTKKSFVIINVIDNFFNFSTPIAIKHLLNHLKSLAIQHLFLPVQFLNTIKLVSDLEVQEKRIQNNYHLLGEEQLSKKIMEFFNLKVFYTCGPREIHSWLFKKNSTARQCSGLIHTDFIKLFIRAEIFPYATLMEYKSFVKAKAAGKVMIKGADYQVQDADICHFLINKQ